MNVNTKSLIAGLVLIVAGLVILGNNLGFFDISFRFIWPWFLIIGGGLFLVGWMADRENYGLLMPASILLVYGFLFLYSVYGDWRIGNLWPFFLIGPGLGFLLMYFFGKKEEGLLIPAGILLGLGLIFLIGRGTPRFFWPILLIIVGLFLLFKARRAELMAPAPPVEESTSEGQSVEEQSQSEPESKRAKPKKKK